MEKHEYLLLLTIVILLHNIFGLSNIIYFVGERFMVDVIKTKGERDEWDWPAWRKMCMNIHELQMNAGRPDGRK